MADDKPEGDTLRLAQIIPEKASSAPNDQAKRLRKARLRGLRHGDFLKAR